MDLLIGRESLDCLNLRRNWDIVVVKVLVIAIYILILPWEEFTRNSSTKSLLAMNRSMWPYFSLVLLQVVKEWVF